MTELKALRDRSILVVIDLQPSFTKAIPTIEPVLERTAFLVEVARALEVPIISTTQNGARMGGLDVKLQAMLDKEPIDKMSFSCWGSMEFQSAIDGSGRQQLVLVGAETHICVAQTALDLSSNEYDVFIPVDAVAGRSEFATKVAFERMSALGVQLTHTESVAYEWLLGADDPRFKTVLSLVKQYPIS